jgi:hypothetical protein
MEPVHFPEVNAKFRAPSDLSEGQCKTIPSYTGTVNGGSLDGMTIVVTAWKPTEWELEQLNAGNPVFLTCIGGLPPHMMTTSFHHAIRPA